MTGITVDLIDEIVEAFNRHDIEKILTYFSDDGEMVSASGNQGRGSSFKGKESIEAALRSRFTACPDIQWVDGKTGFMAAKPYQSSGSSPIFQMGASSTRLVAICGNLQMGKS
ncbi:YybH family protein [Pseudomonas sp. NPDC089996]|uniref:YybH family protein n=1 Tax=Pseudomonas sp. NPDC089996 TaxID=3364474 RepID=UPI00382423A5